MLRAFAQFFRSLRRLYGALLLQEDLEEEQRALSLGKRFQQARELAVPVLLTSLILNGATTIVMLGTGGLSEPSLRGVVGATGLIGAEVLALAIFLLVGSFHLRAGLWFGVFHVATGFAALVTTLTYSHSVVLYLWMGFLLGLSTSFCFGWTRAWYQVGLSYAVILLFGALHLTRLFIAHKITWFVFDSLRFLLPNVIGFFIALYSFQGYVAWGLFASMVYLIARLLPARSPALLEWGPVHLDNTLQFAVPFLYSHLLLAYDQEPEATLQEVRFIFDKRPYQKKVAQAALNQFLLSELGRVARPEDFERMRESGLLRNRLYDNASKEIRDFIREIVPDGSESRPVGVPKDALERLDRLTEDWGQGNELQQKLKVVTNRWKTWNFGGNGHLGGVDQILPVAALPHNLLSVDQPSGVPQPNPVARPVSQSLPGIPSRETLREAMVESFSLTDLSAIAYDLGIDWEELEGGKTDRVVEVLLLMERRNQIDLLLQYAKKRNSEFESRLSKGGIN
jgi:hypothetical protein